MTNFFRKLSGYFRRRKPEVENWQFLIPSYTRVSKDFIFSFRYELAKRSLKNPELKDHIESITLLAEETFKNSLFMNAKTVNKL